MNRFPRKHKIRNVLYREKMCTKDEINQINSSSRNDNLFWFILIFTEFIHLFASLETETWHFLHLFVCPFEMTFPQYFKHDFYFYNNNYDTYVIFMKSNRTNSNVDHLIR